MHIPTTSDCHYCNRHPIVYSLIYDRRYNFSSVSCVQDLFTFCLQLYSPDMMRSFLIVAFPGINLAVLAHNRSLRVLFINLVSSRANLLLVIIDI